MEYIQVKDYNDCIEVDKLLSELIKFESAFDSVINGNCKIEGFHKEVLEKDKIFVYYAKDDNNIVGYIFAYLKSPYNDVINTNVIMLESLFIKEEYRHKGVGRTLISMLENWAKDNFKNYVVEIVCLSNNKNALEFYKSLGYSDVKLILRK